MSWFCVSRNAYITTYLHAILVVWYKLQTNSILSVFSHTRIVRYSGSQSSATAIITDECRRAIIHQVYARLRDVETGLAGVERHVDSLMDIGHAPDTLRYGRRVVVFWRSWQKSIPDVLMAWWWDVCEARVHLLKISVGLELFLCRISGINRRGSLSVI